jgi:hypothetical protein
MIAGQPIRLDWQRERSQFSGACSTHHVAKARFRCERRPAFAMVVDRLDLTVFQHPLVEQNLA